MEAPQQYTQRILGYLEGKKPMEILAATPPQIARLVEGVSRKKLSQRPASHKWSVTEILAHLADTEISHSPHPRSQRHAHPGFDQDAWAKFSDYAKHDPVLSLEAFRITRQRTMRLLKSLPRESWDFYGMHSERGQETVTRVVEMLAGHDVNHMKQIKESLSKK
jgi:hypothetical protein